MDPKAKGMFEVSQNLSIEGVVNSIIQTNPPPRPKKIGIKDVIKRMGHSRAKSKLPEMYGSVNDYLEHKRRVMEQL